ncbi:DUF896 domain-containing protein [Lapidilactobacillus wuchangensis]|uniref:DUF896 domain-containing protein n=1 Tax=Lapidilactobacillus wuchangensis TaxID=2486001 RepID=UPI000F7B6B95|nr:DUF896 domain-containing protein [Lapidilactobacillus wuchangensis]
MSEIDPKLIARINELAAKAKTSELSPEEEQERQQLRQDYLQAFRDSFRTQIEDLRIYNQEGKEVTPDKVKKVQRDKNLRDD